MRAYTYQRTFGGKAVVEVAMLVEIKVEYGERVVELRAVGNKRRVNERKIG